jgi:hypothetical protein
MFEGTSSTFSNTQPNVNKKGHGHYKSCDLANDTKNKDDAKSTADNTQNGEKEQQSFITGQAFA